jgi:hypothetical protein
VADICTLEDGSFISGGLADGSIVVFDNKYELIGKGTIFVALLACEAFRIFFFFTPKYSASSASADFL